MGFFFDKGKKEDKKKTEEEMVKIDRGRQGIGSHLRNRVSWRAMKGKLEVVNLTCPYCHHDKALRTLKGATKCSKCKRERPAK